MIWIRMATKYMTKKTTVHLFRTLVNLTKIMMERVMIVLMMRMGMVSPIRMIIVLKIVKSTIQTLEE